MESAFENLTFDGFVETLMMKQPKLIDMGLLTSSKTKALVASDDTKLSQGGISYNNNKKKKWKQKSQSKTQQSLSSQQGNSSSNKKDKIFCAYCKKSNHDEHPARLRE